MIGPPAEFGPDYSHEIDTRRAGGVPDALLGQKIEQSYGEQHTKNEARKGGQPVRPVPGAFERRRVLVLWI